MDTHPQTGRVTKVQACGSMDGAGIPSYGTRKVRCDRTSEGGPSRRGGPFFSLISYIDEKKGDESRYNTIHALIRCRMYFVTGEVPSLWGDAQLTSLQQGEGGSHSTQGLLAVQASSEMRSFRGKLDMLRKIGPLFSTSISTR